MICTDRYSQFFSLNDLIGIRICAYLKLSSPTSMVLLQLILPTFYHMDRPAWSTAWYSGIVTDCFMNPQVKLVDSKTGEMMQNTRIVLEWIKECRGHELWQLCCDLIASINASNYSIDFQRECTNIWFVMIDQLEYMSLLIKEFSGRPAEL